MSSIFGMLSSLLTKRDMKKILSGIGDSTIHDVCHIDGAISEKVIKKHSNEIFKKVMVMKDGGLCTLIKIDGVTNIMGNEAYNDSIDFLNDSLRGILNKTGHKLTFYFTRDKKAVERDVDLAMEVLIQKNKVMGLNSDDFIREQRRMFIERCCHESCYLALQTMPSVLSSKASKKRSRKRTMDICRENGLLSPKYSAYGQNVLDIVGELVGVHSSFINQITSNLTTCNKSGGVRHSVMNSRAAIKTIREFIDQERTSKNWSPILIGDDYLPKVKEIMDHDDISHLSPPGIAEQIITRDYTSDNTDNINTITRLGRKVYSAVHVARPPAPFKSFSDLFDAIPTNTPWRMSFSIETGSENFLSKIKSKSRSASFLAFSSSINEVIKDAAEDMIHRVERGLGVLVKGNICFCTWGDTVDEVQTNASNIATATESWGGPQLIDEKGDVPLAVLETIPCVTNKKASDPFIFYLEDFISSIPITRPTSVWDNGAFMAVTEDNKIWSYASASDKQASWIELLSAKSGSGKSLTLNALNLSLFSSVPSGKLPRIAIIDIGVSSKLFIDHLRAIFPEHQRKHFKSYKLKMTEEYRVNIFDTPLGCRYPVAMDKTVIINFLVTLLNDAGSKTIKKGLLELVSVLVDQMYSDSVNFPEKYTEGMDLVLDKAIEHCKVANSDYKLPTSGLTYWDVCDYLALCGDTDNAMRAQRKAVPSLPRASSALGSDNIKAMYSTDSEGLNLIAECKRAISTSSSLYPNLSGTTNFDLSSEDKIVSLDLSEVANGSSEAGAKQTCLMYILARYLLCKDFYKDIDTIPEIKSQHILQRGIHSNEDANEFYLAYHTKRYTAISAEIKKIVYDEFHMTNGSPALADQVDKDMRVGRKYNIVICLSSQRDEDFTESMIEQATTIILMSRGTADKQNKKFNLNQDAADYMRKLNGPTRRGAPMLIMCKTNEGEFTQFVYLPLPSILVWAWSTTKEDVLMRNYVFGKCRDYLKTLRVLDTQIPYGCKSLVAEIVRSSGVTLTGDDDAPLEIYENIFEDRIKDRLSEMKMAA